MCERLSTERWTLGEHERGDAGCRATVPPNVTVMSGATDIVAMNGIELVDGDGEITIFATAGATVEQTITVTCREVEQD